MYIFILINQLGTDCDYEAAHMFKLLDYQAFFYNLANFIKYVIFHTVPSLVCLSNGMKLNELVVCLYLR